MHQGPRTPTRNGPRTSLQFSTHSTVNPFSRQQPGRSNSGKKRRPIFESANKSTAKDRISLTESSYRYPQQSRRLHTNPNPQPQLQTPEALIDQVSGVLRTLKNKYELYVKAEEENAQLTAENQSLKAELAKLRIRAAQKDQHQNELEEAKKLNKMYKEKMNQARKQVFHLKKLFVSQQIQKAYEKLLDLLN